MGYDFIGNGAIVVLGVVTYEYNPENPDTNAGNIVPWCGINCSSNSNGDFWGNL